MISTAEIKARSLTDTQSFALPWRSLSQEEFGWQMAGMLHGDKSGLADSYACESFWRVPLMLMNRGRKGICIPKKCCARSKATMLHAGWIHLASCLVQPCSQGLQNITCRESGPWYVVWPCPDGGRQPRRAAARWRSAGDYMGPNCGMPGLQWEELNDVSLHRVEVVLQAWLVVYFVSGIYANLLSCVLTRAEGPDHKASIGLPGNSSS